MLLTAALAGCSMVPGPGGVRGQPENADAIAPVSVVTEGSGAGGDYRAWAFDTSDGMACVEVASDGGSSATCDPSGGPPVGGGVGRSERGVVAWAVTADPLAVAAILHDSRGAKIPVALVSAQGLRLNIAVVSLGSAADPLSMEFTDAAGLTVGSVVLR
jgi:hypothetical protein